MGGHKPKTLRGEHAQWLIARCKEKDFTISQLVAELLAERAVKVDRHSVWGSGTPGSEPKKSLFAEADRLTSPDGVSSGRSIRDARWSRLVFIDGNLG